VEIVDPQEIARARVMTGSMHERQRQGKNRIDRRSERAQRRNGRATFPELLEREAIGERLPVRDFQCMSNAWKTPCRSALP